MWVASSLFSPRLRPAASQFARRCGLPERSQAVKGCLQRRNLRVDVGCQSVSPTFWPSLSRSQFARRCGLPGCADAVFGQQGVASQFARRCGLPGCIISGTKNFQSRNLRVDVGCQSLYRKRATANYRRNLRVDVGCQDDVVPAALADVVAICA